MERKPSKQSRVDRPPEQVTYSFNLEHIKSINIEALAPCVGVPRPPQQFRVQIIVVKPPPV